MENRLEIGAILQHILVGFGLSNATQQILSLYQILLFEIRNYMFMVDLKGFEIICLWIWRVGSWRKDRE